MSGGGGQALVGKWGRMPDGGGIDQIFANWGGTPSPPREKNPDIEHRKQRNNLPKHTIYLLSELKYILNYILTHPQEYNLERCFQHIKI